MKNIISSALIATAAVLVLSSQASAQTANIVVVDTDTVMRTCTACASASSQLQTRSSALQTRAQTLKTSLETEGAPIQKAFDALAGKQPDAALRQRITAFQTKQNAAQQEIETAQQTLQSTAANVQQQIGARLIQVVEQVRARRNAAIAISKGGTLANSTAVDVTTEVLTALNAALPAVSVTPLPQQARPAASGR